MKWHFVMDTLENKSGEWISHTIPDSLYEAVMQSLHERGFLHYTTKEITQAGLDLPGMCSTKREYRSVEIDGLTFSVPCTDFEVFYDKLLKREVRTDAALPYYKLHGWNQCIVLTPEQRSSMLAQMAKLLPEANAQRELENRAWNDAFANMEGAVVAEPGENVGEAFDRAVTDGKRLSIIVGKRPTKDDIGEA